MNIEIKKPSRFKRLIHKIHYYIEETAFNVLLHIPEKMIPRSVMNWLDHYTESRIAPLKHNSVRDRWESVELEQIVAKIRNEN